MARKRNPNVSLRRKLDRRFGVPKYTGFGSRARRAEVTLHKEREAQFPRLHAAAKRRGAKRFKVPTHRFSYLPDPVDDQGNVTQRIRHLGSPTALGDDIIVIMDFKPRSSVREYIMQQLAPAQIGRGRTRRTIDPLLRVKRDLRLVARAYYRAIKTEMNSIIDKVVPKFTGRLRRGMKASLTLSISGLSSIPYILKINTMDAFGSPIMYANPVNNMPQAWLTHPPNTPPFRYWRGRKIWLDDPDAERDWYNVVIDRGRAIAQSRRGMIRNEIIALYGLNNPQLIDVIYNEVLRNLRFA